MRYFVLDVFTDRPLAGNPLAVIPDAADLDAATMQAIAGEFNLSETAFLLPSERCDARARYFTPARELPTAGHPTIGSAYALERLGRLPKGHAASLELNIGPTPLRLERTGAGLARVWMDQGVPERIGAPLPVADAAPLLGLDADDLVRAAEVWSTGNPFLVAQVRDLDALARVRIDRDGLAALLPGTFHAALPFTLATGRLDGDGEDAPDVRCRMLSADLGIGEDPATGSAHGPLGGFLHVHGLVDLPPAGSAEGATVVSHQGVEMGRPSELHVRLERRGERVAVLVGGQAVLVAEGELHL